MLFLAGTEVLDDGVFPYPRFLPDLFGVFGRKYFFLRSRRSSRVAARGLSVRPSRSQIWVSLTQMFFFSFLPPVA